MKKQQHKKSFRNKFSHVLLPIYYSARLSSSPPHPQGTERLERCGGEALVTISGLVRSTGYRLTPALSNHLVCGIGYMFTMLLYFPGRTYGGSYGRGSTTLVGSSSIEALYFLPENGI